MKKAEETLPNVTPSAKATTAVGATPEERAENEWNNNPDVRTEFGGDKAAFFAFRIAVSRARKIQKFLSQPFHVAEVFTGTPGVFVKLEDTIKGFKGILEGKYDDIPEQAFYMVGTIEDALKKAEAMKKAA